MKTEEYNYFYSEEYVDEVAYYNNMLFLANGLVYDWGERGGKHHEKICENIGHLQIGDIIA